MYSFLSLTARDVMTRTVVTISPIDSLAELERLFSTHQFNACPVIEDGQLVGLVSKLDFLKAFLFDTHSVVPPYQRIMQKPVGEIMVRTVVTVPEDRPLTRVVQMMVDLRTKSFPVVNEHGAVTGMIAREDIMRALRQSTSS